jgi:hypothetical protein
MVAQGLSRIETLARSDSVFDGLWCSGGNTRAVYIKLDGRFDDTSVWVQGERRLVFLKGCVKTREQSEALEKAVWLVDDVMGVVNYLRVGDEPVRYVPAQK